MNLPVYQHINLKSASLEDLGHILHQDLNLKHPVVINLKNLDLDQQREVIGLIENYYTGQNISFNYPYPVYLLSHHEPSITKVVLIQDQQELPKFYTQRDSKMNVKESHLAGKNRLLQQEVKNSDASANLSDMQNYGEAHRIIYELEKERSFYRSILNRLVKGSKDG
jgi:hypothetical protein